MMQHVSAASLTSLTERVTYLSSFLDLGPSDTEALLASAPLIAPLVPAVLDAVYTKLLSYDITAQAFVAKNTDYEGEVVKNVAELTLEHPQIALRKDFLKNYLVKLVTTKDLSPDSKFWVYLNNVGIMHTGHPGFKHREKRPDLRVEYIHMGALLGYVVDIVVGAVMTMDEVDNVMKSRVIRALNKVIWIQNDLMARHYIEGDGVGVKSGEATPPESINEEKESPKKVGGGCPFSGN
jgi:hypothetical protein